MSSLSIDRADESSQSDIVLASFLTAVVGLAVDQVELCGLKETMANSQTEHHVINRVGWLRAAVLGANDGIISTASLMAGVASAVSSPSEVFITGIAGLVAGSMAMAAGEYVSVSSQADSENADLNRERAELVAKPEAELDELTKIYISRGVEPTLARQVAQQLMAKDALGAHVRDELGISDALAANPIQAALTSAVTFASGAAVPIAAALLCPKPLLLPAIFGVSLIVLGLLGAMGARAGGANMLKAAIRVAFWGALAMGITAVIGALIGKAV